MKASPRNVPTNIAISAQNTFRPNRIANPPKTKLKTFALVANHSVNWLRTRPCRSLSGMTSMEWDSISPSMPSTGVRSSWTGCAMVAPFRTSVVR